VRGEQLYPVSPLETPSPAELFPSEPVVLSELERSPAVALFVERTRERVPDFALTRENASVVAAICTRLDGLPLAIELAAARTPILSPESLLERLDPLLPLLVQGPSDLPARQRTLRDTIAWSHSLLNPSEQRLFRALAVFRGGCSLELAEAVCMGDESGETQHERGDLSCTPRRPQRTLEGISSLVEKSLLVRQTDPDGRSRFRMLDTIREFATAELTAAEEHPLLQRRLAEAMVRLAEAAELDGPRQGQWLARLDAERDNIRAVLAWSIEQGQPGIGVHLVCSLLRWFSSAPVGEWFDWAEKLLRQLGDDVPPGVRAEAAFLAGLFAWNLGESVRSRTYLDTSVAIWRAERQQRKLAYGLARQALTGQDDGAGAARHAGEEAVALFRQIGDRSGLAESLLFLGLVLVNLGELTTAETLTHESLAICRELGQPRLLGGGLRRLGLLALARGDPEGARAWYDQSLRFYRAADETRFTALALASLAQTSQHAGDVDRAAVELRETLALARQTGNRWSIAAALEGLAWVASRRGRPERAAQLFGAAAKLCDPAWFLLASMHRETRKTELDAVRSALGEAAFVAAWAEGQALPLEQAIAEALEERE
jgi:predicted ATPase